MASATQRTDDKQYVRTDEHGVFRVGDSRVMLDSVIAGFQVGHSPETICQQYPSLTLEDVYGAITYYLAHTDEVNSYLNSQSKLWAALRAQSEALPNPVLERLRNTLR